MNTDKLAAFLEKENANPVAGLLKQKKNAAANQEGEASTAPDGQKLLGEMGDFAQTLRDSMDIIEGLAEEAGEEITSEGADEAGAQMIADALGRMPDELRAGIAKHIGGKSEEEVHAICSALAEEGLVQDVDLVCRWLFMAGQSS